MAGSGRSDLEISCLSRDKIVMPTLQAPLSRLKVAARWLAVALRASRNHIDRLTQSRGRYGVFVRAPLVPGLNLLAQVASHCGELKQDFGPYHKSLGWLEIGGSRRKAPNLTRSRLESLGEIILPRRAVISPKTGR